MRRREFITLIGGAAAWPLTAHAQQIALPVIGFLHSGSAANSPQITGFEQGLKETDFLNGSMSQFNIALPKGTMNVCRLWLPTSCTKK
jgi:hypothetical protein